jgi:LacI family transcriptional regulator
MGKAKATLKSISETLQISISTVSRALKDHPDIAEQTKKKVRELAEMMDYEPNAFAIYLRTNHSKLLGLIVPEISDYFYHSFIASVEEEARKKGYSLMILQSGDNADTELANIRLCKLNRVAGIMVALSGSGRTDFAVFERLEDSGIPVIFFDKVPENKGFSAVCLADEEAGRLAAEALLRKARHKILAIFGKEDLTITRKRLQAFTKAFKNSGSEAVLQIMHAANRNEALQITTNALALRPMADGLFCMSDEILAGAMKAVQELKIPVPDKLGIVSISNGFIPGLFNPEITYVETSGDQLGRAAFKEISERLENNGTPREETIGARIVEGKSL